MVNSYDMKKLSVILLVCVFFVGCAPQAPRLSTEEIMDSWLNHHKSKLIKEWGPPHRVTTDGKGGEIYIYESSSTSATTFNNFFGVELDNPITTLNTNTRYRQFYIDRNGKIYYWRSKG